MEDPTVRNYIALFERRLQHGGGDDYPVFAGVRYYQTGSGFGDILRGIFRFILPVAAKGASTFLSNVVNARDEGADWKSAAKSAIAPTATSALGSALDQLSQKGNGKRRKPQKRKAPQYKSSQSKKSQYQNWNF